MGADNSGNTAARALGTNPTTRVAADAASRIWYTGDKTTYKTSSYASENTNLKASTKKSSHKSRF